MISSINKTSLRNRLAGKGPNNSKQRLGQDAKICSHAISRFTLTDGVKHEICCFYTPLVTPFHKDFTLNKQAMQASIDLLIDVGIHVLIVAGPEGEYYAMSMKERVYLMRLAKEMIARRVPMIIGASAIRTEECTYVLVKPRCRRQMQFWSQRRR